MVFRTRRYEDRSASRPDGVKKIVGNKVAAIIPARGGSKGLPGKNVRPLGGKPLIAWSIKAARDCQQIDEIFVSTDDPAIADIAKSWGAEVPFMRPPELATDKASISGAVNHAIQHINLLFDFSYASFIILYPTHPFRTRNMLATAADSLRNEECAKFVTVKTIHASFDDYAYIDNGSVTQAPQRLSPARKSFYCRNYGLVSGHRSGSNTEGTYLYPVINPVHLIDIDTEDDLRLANLVLERGLHDFEA